MPRDWYNSCKHLYICQSQFILPMKTARTKLMLPTF